MPISRTPDFIINSTTADVQASPNLLALDDSRFVALWTSYEGAGPGYDIRARFFAADGTATGNDFVVNTTTVNSQEVAQATALADGRFVATWYSFEGSSYEIRARIYGADGTPAGADFIVNSTTANYQFNVSISTLADGRFVATWQTQEGATTNYDIQARIFNADGTPAGPDFLVNSTTLSSQEEPDITALADGRFVATWQSYEGGTTGFDIRARLFNADGTPSAPDFIVNSTTSFDQLGPTITPLVDGRFVASWQSYEGASGNDIRARIFKADGTAAGADFVVNTTTASDQGVPDFTALADGRFIATWYSNEGATSNDIRARIYNSDGSAAGADFVVNSTVSSSQFTPTVTALADGRVAVAWYSDEGATSYDIRASILDPNNFQGTSGNDSWRGGNSVDRLYGYAGDDNFGGGGDNDYLNGGGGGDTLRGGAGNDRLEGGLSNDFLFGEKDNDTLWGGQGKDILNGGKGNDKFLYMNRSEAGDAITKFEKVDHFVFEGQAFKLGTYAGQLKEKNFYSTTTNKAHDANDRFIFRTGDDTLWFDADGKGGVASVKIADLSNNFNLHASDILIV